MELDTLLQQAIALQASDLHLATGVAPRFRVDGRLLPARGEPLTEACLAAWLGRLDDDPDASDCAYTHPGGTRFRVNRFLQARGSGAVFRRIPEQVPTLDALSAPASVRRLAESRAGLVLVTGATGSGKSTTLAAMLDHRNRHCHDHLLTIEDPIEFLHPCRSSLVNQRQVGRHAGSVATALRDALRQDPDVILIGELRDLESIRLALVAAETGHLVLASLHTASAVGAIDRVIDVFPGTEQPAIRSMLAGTLLGVIAQRLVPALAGGRLALLEILLSTPAVRHLVREGKTAQLLSVLQTGGAAGMQTLAQAVQQQRLAGRIGADVADAVLADPG